MSCIVLVCSHISIWFQLLCLRREWIVSLIKGWVLHPNLERRPLGWKISCGNLLSSRSTPPLQWPLLPLVILGKIRRQVWETASRRKLESLAEHMGQIMVSTDEGESDEPRMWEDFVVMQLELLPLERSWSRSILAEASGFWLWAYLVQPNSRSPILAVRCERAVW